MMSRNEKWMTTLQYTPVPVVKLSPNASRRAARPRRALDGGHVPDGGRGVRILGGLLATLVIVWVAIMLVGESYGTHRPVAGHSGNCRMTSARWGTVVCDGR
jgi:hypothetical protein